MILDCLGIAVGERHIHAVHLVLTDGCRGGECQFGYRVDGERSIAVAGSMGHAVRRRYGDRVRTSLPCISCQVKRLGDRCGVAVGRCATACGYRIAVAILYSVRIRVSIRGVDGYGYRSLTLADAVYMINRYTGRVIYRNPQAGDSVPATINRGYACRYQIPAGGNTRKIYRERTVILTCYSLQRIGRDSATDNIFVRTKTTAVHCSLCHDIPITGGNSTVRILELQRHITHRIWSTDA